MTTTPGDPALSAGSTVQIQITERRPAHPDASGLLRAFHREQVERYGFADAIELPSGDYAPPRGSLRRGLIHDAEPARGNLA